MVDAVSTREEILEKGLAMASEAGLGGLTIGGLARAVGLSKAGLYAHFDSKADILREILRTAVDRFVREGVRPALGEPPGEPRVRALFDAWLAWTEAPPLPGGCVFISSAAELDDREGPLRDYLVERQTEWADLLAREVDAARQAGHFRPDLDPEQFVFELYAVILSFHYYHRLFRDRRAEPRARFAFEELIRRARRPKDSVSSNREIDHV